MRGFAFTLTILLAVFSVRASEVKVHLFSEKSNLNEVVCRIQAGGWKIEEIPSARLNNDQLLRVKWLPEGIQISQGDRKWLVNSAFTIVPWDTATLPVLDVFRGEKDLRRITGAVQVSRRAQGLKLVAHLPLEDYVAGVVEAEVGHVSSVEFLAAQAVVARSYALAKMELRGARVDALLTDGPSDQVFRGFPWGRNRDSILTAVRETSGWVLTTAQDSWFPVVFHSNSGGETVASEDAWSQALPELRSVIDTFSTVGAHAEWEALISCAEWENFMIQQVGDSLAAGDVETHWFYPLEQGRQRYILYHGKKLDAVQMRRHFELKSTWFHIRDCTGDSLVLAGRGFGHGVGMSQEGAMEMADRGYTWREILLYYYTDVKLQHLTQLKRL